MAGLNKVILIGRLGRDPEIKETKDGRPYGKFSIATSKSWKDKQTGERTEKTEWHDIIVFNQQAINFLKEYVKKGHNVYIEGELQTNKWTDKNDVKKSATLVVIQAFTGVLKSMERSGGSNGNAGDNCHDDTNPPTQDETQASGSQYANASQGGYDDTEQF